MATDDNVLQIANISAGGILAMLVVLVAFWDHLERIRDVFLQRSILCYASFMVIAYICSNQAWTSLLAAQQSEDGATAKRNLDHFSNRILATQFFYVAAFTFLVFHSAFRAARITLPLYQHPLRIAIPVTLTQIGLHATASYFWGNNIRENYGAMRSEISSKFETTLIVYYGVVETACFLLTQWAIIKVKSETVTDANLLKTKLVLYAKGVARTAAYVACVLTIYLALGNVAIPYTEYYVYPMMCPVLMFVIIMTDASRFQECMEKLAPGVKQVASSSGILSEAKPSITVGAVNLHSLPAVPIKKRMGSFTFPPLWAAVLALCLLARHAYALDANSIGGAGWALSFSSSDWYPQEVSSRTLMQRGLYAEQDGMQAKQMVKYESPADFWSSLTSFTIEAWVKPDHNKGRSCCWPIFETYNTVDPSANQISFKIVDNGALNLAITSLNANDPCATNSRTDYTTWSGFGSAAAPPKDGSWTPTWHHVAVVYQHDGVAHSLKFYGDGAELSAVNCNTTRPLGLTGGAFVIGYNMRETPVSPYEGAMDEVRVWNGARSSAQILDTMHRPLTPPEIATTVLYYSFDNYNPANDLWLYDLGPHAFNIKMSDNMRNAPSYVPSTATVLGSSLAASLTRTTSAAGTVNVLAVPASSAAGLSVTIQTLPTCKKATTLTISAGGASLAALGTTAASNAIVLSAPQALQSSPVQDVCSFTMTVTDTLLSTTSPPLTVWVMVNTNRKPLVGNGGGALYCDGGDWAYAKDFSFNRPDYGEYTIEFWTYHFYSTGPVASLYSFGNNEIAAPGYDKNWCPGTPTTWNTSDFCIGRFVFDQFTSAMRAEVYNSWNPDTQAGFLSVDISRVFEQWKHMAIVSSAATLSMYLNGELLGSVPNYPFYGRRDGLSLCHWPFYGGHFYTGFVDEFRVFNYAREGSEIRSQLYAPMIGNEPGLIGYWNFDQYADAMAFDQPYPISTWIKDQTAGANHLNPGGCAPNKPPYCPLGVGRCRATEDPQWDCYDADGTAQLDGGQPTLYLSNAPIGGYATPILVEAGGNSSFVPSAQDLDGDNIIITMTSVPTRGYLYTAAGAVVKVGDTITAGAKLTFNNPDVYGGGNPATEFAYSVYDGLEYADRQGSIKIHVKCPIGTILDPSTNTCKDCPHGTYQPQSGFASECLAYSNFVWSSPLGGVVTAVTSALLLYICAIAGAVMFYRDSKIIRSASPSFCMMILFGCILGLLDVYTYVDIPNSATCVLQPLFVAVGFTIAIGSLVIKTLRIHLLFNHPFVARRYQKAMRDWVLVAVSGVAVGVDFVILAIWYAIDRPRPQLLSDVGGSLYWGCDSINTSVTRAASTTLIVYNALWLFLGIYSVIQVRNVKSAYNESQHIIPCVYILLLLSIILLPMNYASKLFGFNVRSLFVVFLLIVGSCFVASQLFVPKIMAIKASNLKHKGKEAREAEPLRTLHTSQMHSDPSDTEGSHVESVDEEKQDGEQQTINSPCLMVTLVQAQIGSSILGSFSAHSLIYIVTQEAIIVRKYRQTVSNFYAIRKQTLKAVNDTTISVNATDGETIKIKFESKEQKDQWMASLRGGAGGKRRGTVTNASTSDPSRSPAMSSPPGP
ncbi:hypothetical protein HDU89_004096 [Geranomyces variabilis]|nr:hypothetical protein HDU89_004096 [Geranomyces variabilis]